MDKRKYTLEDVKKAFWNTFHESGELWFDYLGDDEGEHQECTEQYWDEFKENLEREEINV